MKNLKKIDTIALIFGFLLLLIGINSDRFIGNETVSLIFGVITIILAIFLFNISKILGKKSVQSNNSLPNRQQKVLFISAVITGLLLTVPGIGPVLALKWVTASFALIAFLSVVVATNDIASNARFDFDMYLGI